MTEFFISALSLPAPFFPDRSVRFIEADTPHEALLQFVEEYDHPFGLFVAQVYKTSDVYHKSPEKFLAQYSQASGFLVYA